MKMSGHGFCFLVCLLLAACATSPGDRSPAASSARPALDGLRVNPLVYPPTEQWVIRLHDGSRNGWKKDDAHLKSHDVSTPGARAEFSAHLGELSTNDDIPKKAKAALAESLRLLAVLDKGGTSAADQRDAFAALTEIISAFNHFFASDAPYKTWVGTLPLRALDLIGYPIMTDVNPSPATNVAAGQSDPTASSWWQPRRARDEDFYFGAGRTLIPDLSKQTCSYLSAKKSGGTHGGFRVTCDGADWKIKFGNETKTEPFISRLVWALGYNVHIVDYLPSLKLRYDRNLIQDYNSREPIKFTVTSGIGPKFISRDVQKVYNPFVDAIESAVLVDGTVIAAEDLQTRLLPGSDAKKFDWKFPDDSAFDPEFEKTIKFLVLREASAEAPRLGTDDIGTWSWNEFDHPNRRELRGFALLSALVANYDIRTDNNSVSVRTDELGLRHLEFCVSDLGAGFGSSRSLLNEKSGNANTYPWELVRRQEATPGQSPYVFSTYKTILPAKPFSDVANDDARWMIRKLAGISENQILAALIVSGHKAAETRLLLEKLIDRRKQLINTFSLASEFPQLIARVTDRHLNYNPRRDPVPQTQIGSQLLRADVGRQKILDGQLVDF